MLLAIGLLCWFLMTRFGRATLYMGGMAGMLVCLLVTGGLGFKDSPGTSWAIGSLLIFQTLINMTTIGPVSSGPNSASLVPV